MDAGSGSDTPRAPRVRVNKAGWTRYIATLFAAPRTSSAGVLSCRHVECMALQCSRDPRAVPRQPDALIRLESIQEAAGLHQSRDGRRQAGKVQLHCQAAGGGPLVVRCAFFQKCCEYQCCGQPLRRAASLEHTAGQHTWKAVGRQLRTFDSTPRPLQGGPVGGQQRPGQRGADPYPVAGSSRSFTQSQQLRLHAAAALAVNGLPSEGLPHGGPCRGRCRHSTFSSSYPTRDLMKPLGRRQEGSGGSRRADLYSSVAAVTGGERKQRPTGRHLNSWLSPAAL